MQWPSFISSQRFYSFLMGVSAMLMFLSLQPEQNFEGSRHPIAAAILLFCGVFSGYRLADLKPQFRLRPLRLNVSGIPADFVLVSSVALIFLLIAAPGLKFLLQFGAATLIAISYYTISAIGKSPFGGLRSIFLIKNLALALAWALATAPLHPGELTSLYHFAERFLYLLALSLLIDIRDLQTDRSSLIRTVAGRLGVNSTRLIAVLLLTGSMLLAWDYSQWSGDITLLPASMISYLLTLLATFFLSEDTPPLTYLLLIDGNLLLHGILTFAFSRL